MKHILFFSLFLHTLLALAQPDDNPANTAGILVIGKTPIQQMIAFYEAMEKPSQSFMMNNPQQQMKIVGAQGTEILIPANAFQDKNGNPVNEPVVITLREYYHLEDMLTANLNTQTDDGQLLETGGMIYVEAKTEKGEPLTIQKNQSLQLTMPVQNTLDSMQVFAGHKNAQGQINWRQAGQNNRFIPANFGSSFPEIDWKSEYYVPFIVEGYVEEKGKKRKNVIKINQLDERFEKEKADLEAQFNPLASRAKPVLSRKIKDGVEIITLYPKDVQKLYLKFARLKASQDWRGKHFIDTITCTARTYQPYISDKRELRYSQKQVSDMQKNPRKGFNYEFKGATREDSFTLIRKVFTLYMDSTDCEQFMTKWKNYSALAMATKFDSLPQVSSVRTKANTLFQTMNAVATINQLGWINCDRFYNDLRPKTTLVFKPENFKIPSNSPALLALSHKVLIDAKLIFVNEKAIMQGRYNNEGEIEFPNIPIGTETYLIASQYTKDGGKVLFASLPLTITKRNTEIAEFELLTLEEYKAKLAEIGKQWKK
ncbi:MAG: hypothetical protein ACKVTZ_17995 [Bacteroidia bacterium]